MAQPDGVWLDAVRRLQALAQNGLAYAENPFDRARYEEVREVAVRLAALGEGTEPEELKGSFSAAVGYATPKVDVRAAAFVGEHVLLVRNVDDGLWSLPGGWAEVGESPREAAEKELLEEAGYRGRVVDVVGVYDRDLLGRPRSPAHIWKIVFLCELDGDPIAAPQATEISEVGLFEEGALPLLSGRTARVQLIAAFARRGDDRRPSEVD